MLFLASFSKNTTKTDTSVSVSAHLRSGLLATGFLLFASIFFSAPSASAQTTVTKVVRGRTTTPSVTPFKKGVIMRGGALVQVQGEESTPVTQAITFPNGTTLQPNGIYSTTDGKNFQLREGDRIDERGVMTRMPVKIEETVTVSGDTTALGATLEKALEDQEYLQLLQRKRALLEEKSKLLDGAAAKSQSSELKTVDAEIAKVKAQLGSSSATQIKSKSTPSKKASTSKKAPAARKATPKK